jgi:hypothetical protein
MAKATYNLMNKTKITVEKQELMKEVDTVNDTVKQLLKMRIDEIDDWLVGYERDYSSYYKLMKYLLANEIKETQTIQKNIYSVRNVLVYAPTQVGKTNAMIEIVKDCVSQGISVVISSDNKKDQMCQLFARLTQMVETNYEQVFDGCFITTVDNKNFDDILEGDNKTFVVCCLDNKTQIQKVYEKIVGVHDANGLPSLCVIHDEADVITKSRNVSDILNTQPESHKKWLECMSNCVKRGISVKRVFVTATPENVVYLHKPGYVWELPIPEHYVGGEKIAFHQLDDFSGDRIVRLLAREVQARQSEGGIILYCVERNKDESGGDDKGTHNSVFENLNNSLRKTGLDAISVYNSDGIKVSLRTKKHRTLFVNKLESNGIKYDNLEQHVFLIKRNEVAISQFYGYLQSVGCRVVLTIGKDLISRGISFVSDHKENPLTATTMIYRPGAQLHQVGLCQAIGRLTGTAQSTLQRRLYTTDDVHTNYMTFLNNQKQIIGCIKENGSKVDNDLISEISLWKASRPIDRRVLKLERDITFWSEDSRDSGYTSDTENEIDGVDLNKLSKWMQDDSLVGKMIQSLYSVNETTLEKFKNDVNYNGTMNEFIHNVDNGRGVKCCYGKVWIYKNNTVTLNPRIREYLDSL